MSKRTILSYFEQSSCKKRRVISENTPEKLDVARTDATSAAVSGHLDALKVVAACTDEKVPGKTVETVCVDSGDFTNSIRGSSWFDILRSEFEKEYFHKLRSFLDSEMSKFTIYPKREEIFSALFNCDFDKIKVVILGQDPYHGPNQAHGLAFSVLEGNAPPPSLKNIFKEAKNDIGITPPRHGNLSSWSTQGVLLLNTCLTVRRGEANSHQRQGWERFTDAIIREVNKKDDRVVFMLWGNPAQKKCECIDSRKHFVISTSHPSPLGATKTAHPFIGSRCFSRCNDALTACGKEPINWNIF